MTVFLIVIGMSLLTMIPRMIPAFLVEKLQFRGWVNRWLNAIPFAALGALIFPGILSVKEGEPSVGIMGGIVAVVLSMLGLNVILVVIGAILTVFLLPI
ncbi:AzlD domain-containing protein [Virgibacillus sp. 179-BFC.A HS]|uniref:AzlD domain-containing protein n=1 Tax=Tigheibacillus jepli TaxID=3035914 RepID=A0ABU5CLB9_9BACI|nr:AzlD domain-containing protein [Virgibacillus sp. 179-BFC.A HS]MDY0406270.1 AzlD domain-containing protein [Virgibacillus sp. 179-BFC.A HS]